MKPLPLFDDAAPLAGRAGVKARNSKTNANGVRRRLKPPAHHYAPAGTSGVAADPIATDASTQRSEVLAVIENAGAFGATDAEVESTTGMRAQSISPRRGELVKLGLVVDSGHKRKTPRGHKATVWVGAEHAKRAGGA